jgi:alanine racemase
MHRPTWVEVDLGAIAHNLRVLRRHLGDAVHVTAVVKADGYGHGAVPVSDVALAGGADLLGVACVEEALELRAAGIDAPILVLSAVLPEVIDGALDADVALTVGDVAFAHVLAAKSQARGATARAHVKIDTGMSRLGLPVEQAVEGIIEIASLEGIRLEGVCTHFPSADDDPEFTSAQVRTFGQIIAELGRRGVRPPCLHLANSAAAIGLPESRFNRVRIGLAMYGLHGSAAAPWPLDLRPALSLKARVTSVRALAAGATVSYGRTYRADRPTTLATVPIGYADGYSRALSNRGAMLVRGRRCPIVGRVCMDATMIDIGALSDAGVGEEVVVYGRQGSERIAVEEVAALLDTIPYEIVCAIGKRVPRRYLVAEEGE